MRKVLLFIVPEIFYFFCTVPNVYWDIWDLRKIGKLSLFFGYMSSLSFYSRRQGVESNTELDIAELQLKHPFVNSIRNEWEHSCCLDLIKFKFELAVSLTWYICARPPSKYLILSHCYRAHEIKSSICKLRKWAISRGHNCSVRMWKSNTKKFVQDFASKNEFLAMSPCNSVTYEMLQQAFKYA